MKFCSLIVTLLVVYTDFAHGVTNSTIEFLFNVNDRPGDGYLLQWQSPTFPAFARSAQAICVYGMWALYDNEDYGNGSPTNTTTIAVQGTNANDCTTTSVGYIIRTIRSLRPLVGDLQPATPMCSFWDKKNFIGVSSPALEPGSGAATTCPPAAAGTAIGSLAFTEAKTAMFAVLTPKSGTCACVDLTKGPFFVSDTNLFPNAEKPIGELMTMAVAATCPSATPTICTMVTTRSFNNVLRSYDFE